MNDEARTKIYALMLADSRNENKTLVMELEYSKHSLELEGSFATLSI